MCVKEGIGKYDMWYGVVCKTVMSCTSVVFSLQEVATITAQEKTISLQLIEQARARLERRLGQDNRRTDVQRIRGQATDEPMSTDLDCTKSRFFRLTSL